jgi:hypothetical protein
MKNKKSEFITLMSRMIGPVLIMCACLLCGGTPALGQEAGKPVIEPDKSFGEGGTKETTTIKTAPHTTTKTEVYKDPKGVERIRNVTTIEPDKTYGEGGTRETLKREGKDDVTVVIKDPEGHERRFIYTYKLAQVNVYEMEFKDVKVEEIRYYKSAPQGLTGFEHFQYLIYMKIVRIDGSGKELDYEEAHFLGGGRVKGIRRILTEKGEKVTERINPTTGRWETGKFISNDYEADEIGPPPEDTTTFPTTFKANEIVGGFSVIREESDPEDFNTYGFQSSYTRNLNKTFGLTVDFSANFIERGGVDLSKTSFLGGVNFLPFPGANGDDKVRVFGRALFGVSDLKTDIGTASFTDNAFATQFTGGVDIDLNQHLFIRPVEAGFAPTHFSGKWQGNRVYRFGFGLRF